MWAAIASRRRAQEADRKKVRSGAARGWKIIRTNWKQQADHPCRTEPHQGSAGYVGDARGSRKRSSNQTRVAAIPSGRPGQKLPEGVFHRHRSSLSGEWKSVAKGSQSKFLVKLSSRYPVPEREHGEMVSVLMHGQASHRVDRRDGLFVRNLLNGLGAQPRE